MDSKTDSSPVDSNPFDVLRGTLKDLSDAFTATKAEITSSKKPYVLPRDDPRIVALANILESGTDDANAVSSVCHRLIVNSKQLLVTPPPPREPLPRLVDGVLLNPDGTEAETKPRLKPQEPPAPHRRQAWVDDEPTISEALIAPSTPPAVAAPKSSPPQQPVGALDAPLYCGAAPAILSAAASAQWRVVRVLFELGVDLNAREAVTGRAALHYAAAAGQAELCRDLLAAGAKADSVEGDARTPLMLAALHGHAAVVSVLLEHVRATATAAAAAASNSVGDAPGVSRLDGSDADGSSDDEAVARSPFRDVSDDDSDGPSPMDANGRVAARPKRAAAAASSAKPGMVDSAVGPSDSDSDDGAAARESGAGADGDVSDVEGAIGAAISASAARRSALRGRALLSPAEKVTAALRDAVTAVDSTGDTALHLAVAAPSLTCVELLVAAGATVDAKGAAGTRPIVTAAWQGDDPIVAALLSAHASVDTQNASGYTAAMGAVREGYLTVRVWYSVVVSDSLFLSLSLSTLTLHPSLQSGLCIAWLPLGVRPMLYRIRNVPHPRFWCDCWTRAPPPTWSTTKGATRSPTPSPRAQGPPPRPPHCGCAALPSLRPPRRCSRRLPRSPSRRPCAISTPPTTLSGLLPRTLPLPQVPRR